MNPDLSVVVCTRNQSGYLRKVLGSLRAQALPREAFEVIVVDNGSTDATRPAAESFRDMGNLRYVHDPVVGLSHARNTGWRKARGEIVAYLDDDAVARPDWLARLRDAYRTLRPRPACAGGPIRPIWEIEKPSWLDRELEHYLGIVDWLRPAMFLDEDLLYLPGSNVSYLRSVLEESGGFPLGLGRKGPSLLSNEELWMQSFLRSRGRPIWYDPEIVVHHHVKARRLTPTWFTKRYFWQGVSDVLLEAEISHWRAGRPGHRVLREELLGAGRDVVGAAKILVAGNGALVGLCRIHQRLGRIASRILPGPAREGFSPFWRSSMRERR